MAHRDYESMGSIYVKHYDDRIVIESHGEFIGGVNEKILSLILQLQEINSFVRPCNDYVMFKEQGRE